MPAPELGHASRLDPSGVPIWRLPQANSDDPSRLPSGSIVASCLPAEEDADGDMAG
jgi:hypothetical protein